MLAGQTLGRHRCRVYRKKKHKGSHAKPGRPKGKRDKTKRTRGKAKHTPRQHKHGHPGRPRKVAC